MARAAGAASRRGPQEAQQAIGRFLQSSRKPVLYEAGEEPFPLEQDRFSLTFGEHALVLEVWDDYRTLCRRVTGVASERPGRLELVIERFGKRTGSLQLLDDARPANQPLARHGRRLVFREQFRDLLAKAFPGWDIALLSTEFDLHHSLSPNYPRALLTRGATALAAIGASRGAADPDAALAFGLIWLDYLRHRERRLCVEGLALFLASGTEMTTCLRLRHLNPRAARFELFVHSVGGFAERLDILDHGNLHTRLEACRIPSSETQVRLNPLVEEIRRLPHVESVERGDGKLSLRVRGLEFACVSGGRLMFGVARKEPAAAGHLKEISALAAELARLRIPRSNHPLALRAPEAWLESQVLANLSVVDASLAPQPIYGQVPAVAGVERAVLDLLAVSRCGRLAVLELKASQDLQFPLQALDYWMRVAWHAANGDFTRLGYFPGIELSRQPPRLLLVAPALEFHPTTERLLRYFASHVPVKRLGVGIEWQERLHVVTHLRGAESPCSSG